MGNKIIFITGSAGLIGAALYSTLKQEGYSVYGIDVIETTTSVDCLVDVSSRMKLSQKLNEVKPQIIIHTAAMKSLLECEDNKLKSWNVNVESTAEIVQYANLHNTKIIYISSDMVFDGNIGNYTEEDLPNPINWYGTTKYHSELLVQKLPNSTICRTALVFDDFREADKKQLAKELEFGLLDNQSLLPYYILSRLKRSETVMVSDQVVSSPTHLNLLKVAVKVILDKNLHGVYHCAGSEPISRYNFALKIAKFYSLDKTLIKVDESSILKIRPKKLSLDVNKTYKKFGLNSSDWSVDSIIKSINYKDSI